MAYKVFTNGSPLPASDLNTYLMNQSVMVFANSTARSAALTSPTEGMTTYLEDTNKVEVYTGAAWTDINDNTAAIPKSTVTTAGDLIVANGNASVTRLGIGSTGQVLSSNGTTATWTTPVTPDSVITTQGDLIVGNSSGDAARLGIGTNGQLLQSNGTTASWATVTSGGYTTIATGSLSGTSVNITSIPSGYVHLHLRVFNVGWSSTSNARLFFRINGNTSFNAYFPQVSITGINAHTAMDNWTQASLNVNIYNYTNTTSNFKNVQTIFAGRNTTSTNLSSHAAYGFDAGANAITSIELFSTDGGAANFNAGTYILYGVK